MLCLLDLQLWVKFKSLLIDYSKEIITFVL